MAVLLGLFLMFMLFLMFGLIILLLVSVPFQLIGQYKIAVRAGEKCPWLAFIPGANNFQFGKIAEKFQRADNQKSPRYSIILTVLFALTEFCSLFINLPSQFFIEWVNGNESTVYDSAASSIGVLIVSLIVLMLSFAAMGVSVAYLIFYFKAFHNICLAFDTYNARKYLIISICTLGASIPFHLFAMRHNIPAFTAEERFPKSTYYPEEELN